MIKYLIFLPLLFAKLYAQTPDSVRVIYDSLGNQTTEIYYTMPDTVEEYRTENNNLKQQLNVAMQKLAIYEDEDLEKDGYYAFKFWVRQQVDIVKDFKLKDEITKNPKDDKFYDRVKALGEGLKSSITDLKVLRTELRITQKDDERNELKFKQRTTPESIADNIGNTAGKNM